MKKNSIRFILFSVLILSLPANGSAFLWPDIDQTESYSHTFGEDSDYHIHPPSYTKLDARGTPLPHDANDWLMVRDNITGLIWETKTDDGSLHDRDNTYTWCSSNRATNGGYNGTCGRGSDTEDFIRAINEERYGGHSDWRLPTVKELSSLVNSGTYNPSINKIYFPQTMSYGYWSSTSYAYNNVNAWRVDFFYGYVYRNKKSSNYHIRAVRGRHDSH